jgi:hypothetical protein
MESNASDADQCGVKTIRISKIISTPTAEYYEMNCCICAVLE